MGTRGWAQRRARVCSGLSVSRRGGLCYLDDVDGQLTVAVAIQPLGGHILGPVL